MADTLSLSAKFEVTDKELVLTYQVANRTARDAYLLNRVYRTTPKWDIGPNVVYVLLDADKKAVHLQKKVPDQPPGKMITSLVVPFVTPLRAGATFEETVHVPLPVQEYREYGNVKPDKDAKPVEFEQVDFTLAYYWRVDGGTEEERLIEGDKVIVPKSPPGTRPVFGEAKTEPTKLRIPVLPPPKPAAK